MNKDRKKLLACALGTFLMGPVLADVDLVNGRKLATESCIRCHDVSMDGRFKQYPPSFASIAVYRSSDQILGRIVYPPLHSSMPKIGYLLTPSNIDDLVAYIASLESK